MKQLQCNFTTTEQSKRLLELGVPADSSDLFYSKFECETFGNIPTLCYDKKYSDIVPDGYEKDYLPCWSVGRLIEIILLCPLRRNVTISKGYNPIEILINQLVMLREVGTDFSKLEE